MKFKQTRIVTLTLNGEEATRLQRMVTGHINTLRSQPKVDADQEQFAINLHACLTSTLPKVNSDDL